MPGHCLVRVMAYPYIARIQMLSRKILLYFLIYGLPQCFFILSGFVWQACRVAEKAMSYPHTGFSICPKSLFSMAEKPLSYAV